MLFRLPLDAYRMLYTENHDQNAWDGSTSAIYGDAYPAMLTLSFVTEGIPLIHNGQEVGNQDQLEFFERDPIAWGNYSHPDGALIKQLIAIKKANPALHNGAAGGRIIPVSTDNPGQVLSFAREKDGNRVTVLFNLTASSAAYEMTEATPTYSLAGKRVAAGNASELIITNFALCDGARPSAGAAG